MKDVMPSRLLTERVNDLSCMHLSEFPPKIVYDIYRGSQFILVSASRRVGRGGRLQKEGYRLICFLLVLAPTYAWIGNGEDQPKTNLYSLLLVVLALAWSGFLITRSTLHFIRFLFVSFQIKQTCVNWSTLLQPVHMNW